MLRMSADVEILMIEGLWQKHVYFVYGSACLRVGRSVY